MKKLNLWDHPQFEGVTAAFRKAMREHDDVAIERTRKEIDRLKSEINCLERERVTEELAFNPPEKRKRLRRARTRPTKAFSTFTRTLLLGGGQ